MTEKLCVFCEHFNIEMGDSGYEMTPGTDTVINCKRRYWEMDTWSTDDTFRENIRKAVSCQEYKFVGK